MRFRWFRECARGPDPKYNILNENYFISIGPADHKRLKEVQGSYRKTVYMTCLNAPSNLGSVYIIRFRFSSLNCH